jgi:predicted unusual protein kinase regulating ubiquinone biosynthesis (AarF/ABC1/UbiB family)
MKQQLSPQVLLGDLKRDWPRWRMVLTDLPEQLKRITERSQLSEQQHAEHLQQMATQATQQRRAIFHQVFGFIVALVALGFALATSNGMLAKTLISEFSPWLVGAGVVWAYLGSR